MTGTGVGRTCGDALLWRTILILRTRVASAERRHHSSIMLNPIITTNADTAIKAGIVRRAAVVVEVVPPPYHGRIRSGFVFDNCRTMIPVVSSMTKKTCAPDWTVRWASRPDLERSTARKVFVESEMRWGYSYRLPFRVFEPRTKKIHYRVMRRNIGEFWYTEIFLLGIVGMRIDDKSRLELCKCYHAFFEEIYKERLNREREAFFKFFVSYVCIFIWQKPTPLDQILATCCVSAKW